MVFATPILDQQIHLSQVLTNLIGVGTGLVNLVDGKHHRYIGSLGVGNSLLGGGHHTVVGSHDDDGDIGHLRTTSTHSGEGFVTRSIEECDSTTILQLHVVSTDVLGDTTSLTSNHVGFADIVEQRGLTVIDMSHYSDNGRTRNEIVLIVLLLADGLLHFSGDIFGLESELVGDQIDGLGVEALVDGHHNADRHERGDDLSHIDVHHRSQLTHRHKLGQFQRLALCALSREFLVETLLHGLTLLLTILGALLVERGLVGQTSQRLFNLTCNIFLVHLQRFLIATAILLFLGVLLSRLVDRLLHGLVGFGIDVNTLLTNAHTLFALALLLTLLLGLLLALLALLLLRLLLGTSALVEGVEVDLSLYLQLRSVHDLLLALQLEHFGFLSLLSFHIGCFHLFLRILLLLRLNCRFLLFRLGLGAFRLDLNRLLLFSG